MCCLGLVGQERFWQYRQSLSSGEIRVCPICITSCSGTNRGLAEWNFELLPGVLEWIRLLMRMARSSSLSNFFPSSRQARSACNSRFSPLWKCSFKGSSDHTVCAASVQNVRANPAAIFFPCRNVRICSPASSPPSRRSNTSRKRREQNLKQGKGWSIEIPNGCGPV